jgi:hypothetical protein
MSNADKHDWDESAIARRRVPRPNSRGDRSAGEEGEQA